MGESDARIASLPESIFRELLEVAHADLGADLLHGLGFSEEIVGAVRTHHQPARGEEESRLAWVLAAADLVVTKLGLDGSPPDPALALSGRPPMQALGLGDLEIARVLVDLEGMTEEMLGVLR
jgi:HD-like signal output (HDOD) protein